ncbi:hypothetical protein D7Z54_32005 [Salibacterium salarium]|uniref:Uncharacterized protein n=1 Tax=Salibacterium salarium TaxID=284579 RepID=A0A428MT43_9BACI|nr:hypothetical protein [Salibacterium salarium]RSL29300.1 hypothetical protein D7Z54_32005 [Salibacterium salarium]
MRTGDALSASNSLFSTFSRTRVPLFTTNRMNFAVTASNNGTKVRDSFHQALFPRNNGTKVRPTSTNSTDTLVT